MISDINPEAQIRTLAAPINADTVGGFLDGLDLVIDAIDGRDIEAHYALIEAATARGIYSIFGGVPAGFGASLTVFGPGAVTMRECFGVAGDDDRMTMTRKTFAGLAPVPHAQRYLPEVPVLDAVDESEISFSSVSSTLYLCTALAVTEVLCVLLDRRPPTLAPAFLQIDLLLKELAINNSATHTGH